MIVILDNIRSIQNVGSIFRTADALGVEKIYCCGITPTPLNRFGKPLYQFVKVSLGAEKSVAWEKKRSALQLTAALKKKGYTIFAIEQSKKSVPYYTVRLKKNKLKKTVLIVGHEVKGLSQSVLRASDKILEIPMGGAVVRQAHHPQKIGRGKESLNVAVSFGIVGFHLRYF